MTARVFRIQQKPKTDGERGIPKRAVPEAVVGAGGLEGDFNLYRHEKHEDDPDSAVSLLPREVLDALAREGWPVAPGDLGENLTLEGIAHEALAVGKRFRIGDEVEIEIARAAEPCRNLRILPFVGDEKIQAFIKTLVGRRGMYARVLRPGTIREGDAFVETSRN